LVNSFRLRKIRVTYWQENGGKTDLCTLGFWCGFVVFGLVLCLPPPPPTPPPVHPPHTPTTTQKPPPPPGTPPRRPSCFFSPKSRGTRFFFGERDRGEEVRGGGVVYGGGGVAKGGWRFPPPLSGRPPHPPHPPRPGG